ncbi:hypothetical protein V8G54_008859, partial [Vigna mungo]
TFILYAAINALVPFQLEDAQEFLSFLMDQMHDELWWSRLQISNFILLVNPKMPLYPRLAQGKSWDELPGLVDICVRCLHSNVSSDMVDFHISVFQAHNAEENYLRIQSEIVTKFHHQPHALNIIITTRDSDRNRNRNRNGIRRKHWRNVGLAFNCTFLLFGSVIQLIACARLCQNPFSLTS